MNDGSVKKLSLQLLVPEVRLCFFIAFRLRAAEHGFCQ